MKHPEDRQQPESLEAWDWRATLVAQERSILWLARKTGAGRTTVYRYSWGHRAPSPEWLRKAAAVLGYRRS